MNRICGEQVRSGDEVCVGADAGVAAGGELVVVHFCSRSVTENDGQCLW